MISKQIHLKVTYYVKVLQQFANRRWYPAFIAFLAALDNLIIIIPNDGILISSSMLIPKRWFSFALNVAIGSTIGALALAVLVELYGLPRILEIYPTLDQTIIWTWSKEFFEQYGLVLVFIVAITPIMQHPAVILAGLAETPFTDLTLVIFSGRFIKFLIMAYLGSHAPRLLNKMWGVKDELEEVGVRIK